MKLNLTAGLDKDEEKLFRTEFISSAFMRKQIRNVLQKKIESYYAGMRDKGGYEKSSWAFDQADSIGYIRAMNELKNLLEN